VVERIASRKNFPLLSLPQPSLLLGQPLMCKKECERIGAQENTLRFLSCRVIFFCSFVLSFRVENCWRWSIGEQRDFCVSRILFQAGVSWRSARPHGGDSAWRPDLNDNFMLTFIV